MLSTLLSLIAMECFRRVVEAHIKDSINVTVGYRKNVFADCFWLRLGCKKSQPELPPLQFGPGLLNQQNPQHLFLLHHPQHWLLPDLCIKSHLPGHPADI